MSKRKRTNGSISISNELKISWKIKDAKNIFNIKLGEYIQSPPFEDEDYSDLKWCIELYPTGFDESSKKFIGIFLVLYQEIEDNKSYKFKCNFRLSLNNSEGKTSSISYKCNGANFIPENTDRFTELSGSSYDSFGWKNFAKINEVKDHLDKFLNKHGELEIFCVREKVNKIIKTDASPDRKSFIKPEPNEKDKNDISHPPNSFEFLLGNEILSDVTILLDNKKKFTAHKVILGLKSKYFLNVFKNYKEPTIEMKGFTEKAVKSLLKYIYTDKIDSIKDIAQELYMLSNKFDIEYLKKECEKELISQLTIDNSIDKLLFANSNDAFNLKKEAKILIAKNINQLMTSKNWIKLIESNLISDILQSCQINYKDNE